MEFYDYEIEILSDTITEYLELRKEVKYLSTYLGLDRFFSHYGEQIKNFGPPVTFWTARFESNHRVAKVIIIYPIITHLGLPYF